MNHEKNDICFYNESMLNDNMCPISVGCVCLVFQNDSNLVDPASSHTLVSKIKPCKSKYKQLYSETANGSLYQL